MVYAVEGRLVTAHVLEHEAHSNSRAVPLFVEALEDVVVRGHVEISELLRNLEEGCYQCPLGRFTDTLHAGAPNLGRDLAGPELPSAC